MQNPLLLVLAGPTAVGKTAAAIALARHFNTAVVSADSRQFYREIPIGTAAPSLKEQEGIPHYFIGSHSITEELDAARYEREALALLQGLFREKEIVILCGGSGLYIDALCKGFDPLPKADPALRQELQEILDTAGISALQERLRLLDPEYFKTVDRMNPRRLMRAIEVCLVSGKTFSELRTGTRQPRPFRIKKIALDMDRDQLYDRINRRTDLMMEAGLEAEARAVLPFRNKTALQTVGYKELFDYFDGLTDLKTAVDLIRQHSRNFARRQLTWIRRDGEYELVDAGKPGTMISITETAMRPQV